MSIIQGGLGFPFLAEAVYQYFCQDKITKANIPVCDIPYPELKELVEKVTPHLDIY